MAKCGNCIFFSDLGACRHGHSRRSDVGYFDNACDNFRDYTPKAMEENKQLNVHTCKKCGRTMPLDQFMRNRYGYTYVCLECSGRKKEKTTPTPPHDDNAQLSDDDLIAELIKRGWRGTISKTTHIELEE